jgi:hypothetical protein
LRDNIYPLIINPKYVNDEDQQIELSNAIIQIDVYDSRSNNNTENNQKQNYDDSLASSKRIYPKYEWNWRLEWKQEWSMQYDETKPKYVTYVVNILQEMKTT